MFSKFVILFIHNSDNSDASGMSEEEKLDRFSEGTSELWMNRSTIKSEKMKNSEDYKHAKRISMGHFQMMSQVDLLNSPKAVSKREAVRRKSTRSLLDSDSESESDSDDEAQLAPDESRAGK